MGFLSIMGNSFGCSASGERLVSAARDGDLQEAKALLEYNPRLARYSTFGVRNSPLHYSAAQGHHEIVSLLLESGVDINLRNYRGQTALMQACQFGHWEVVQFLMLFKANIHKSDYLNGGTALHFAAINGHSRCIRLLFADHVPSVPDFWNNMRKISTQEELKNDFDESTLSMIINKPADGGITALHMAALYGHVESVQLLLDLGASFSEVTVEDGSTIDLIGAGSTPLHYAACGGNAQCCQVLIAWGASLTAENANGWTPLMVARSWHRNWLEGVLSKRQEGRVQGLPSSYLSIPLMSIMKIARDSGWRNIEQLPTSTDPCAVCLETGCKVSAEGCGHEFCTRCALYLCSTNSTSTVVSGPPGSIACPLCRHAIVSFARLPVSDTTKGRHSSRTAGSLALTLCTPCSSGGGSTSDSVPTPTTPLCVPEIRCDRIPPFGSSSFCSSLNCQRFPLMRLNSSLCMGQPETRSSLVECTASSSERVRSQWTSRCSRPGGLRRSSSHSEGRRSWFSFNQYIATGSG